MSPRIRFWARPALAGLILALLLPAGSPQAEDIAIREDTGPAGITLRSQESGGVELHFGMDRFAFTPVDVNGQVLQAVSLPGALLPNNAGAPDLAGLGRYVAVPEGATASFTILSSRTQVYSPVEIAPAPVIPKDTDDGPLVYTPDAAIYTVNAYYPASPVVLSTPQDLRGVDAVVVGITPFQYNPVSKELIVYTELEVRVDFLGGSGYFGEDRLRNRFWEPLLQAHLLNYDSLPALDLNLPRERDGFEYIIISPNRADFIAWADTLKAWRKLQGITTEVFTTVQTGTTSGQIEAFLNNAYQTWDPAPVAFLLLGDYPGSGLLGEDPPRDDGITAPMWNSYCVSDNIYADVNTNDLPEMAHGRICARNTTELQRMIGKMLTYERTPHTNAAFYDHPIIAGGWQTERWFILCAEICYGYLANVLGRHPVREYAIYSGAPGTQWSTNPNTPMVVNYFGPNGLGYIPATPQHLTDWGGNATRINADINAGAFMLMHRDHGGETGWGEPQYDNGDLDGLHNTLYPFVFSINCLTGKYNWSSESFSEKFHRIANGAVGLIAASEISYSFVNDAYVWGVMDALWPNFDPGYGQPAPIWDAPLRTAFAQASGKYYLQASSFPYNPEHKVYTDHLFHHHGDAFMTMYSQVPEDLTVIHEPILFTDTDYFTIQADAGALIGLTVDGEIVGSAEATGAAQDIPIIPQSDPGALRVTITKANYFRYDREVEIIPPAGPYLVVGERIVDDDLSGESAGNADGGCDAGEAIELRLGLRNVGTETATNVRATLATENPHIAITAAYQDYGDILPGTQVFCLEDFDFAVAPTCPDGEEVSFTANIESDNRMLWEKRFTLVVEAPVIGLVSYQINDVAGGNGDGRVDPGETVRMTPLVGNTGSEDATGVDIYLHIYSPYITMLSDHAALPVVPAGGQAAPFSAFEFAVDPDCPDPDILAGNLVVSADWEQGAFPPFTLPVGGFWDDVEDGAGAWTNYVVTGGFVNQWHRSSARNYTPGGAYSWKFGDTGAGDYANRSDGALESEALPLRSQCFLRFRHWMEAETSQAHSGYCYDGGMVEMSVDGGAWTQIAPVGGYPYRIRTGSNPGPWPAETLVYSGNINWAAAVFDVSGYSGTARFRFRFGSDGADVREGWYIDDVEWSGTAEDPQSGDWTPVALRPAVEQNRPNPFNPQTVIAYRLPARGEASLAIFDAGGRLVRTLFQGVAEPGVHYVSWDGRGDDGTPAGAGVYFYRFAGHGVQETRKMVLTR